VNENATKGNACKKKKERVKERGEEEEKKKGSIMKRVKVINSIIESDLTD